MNSNSQIPLKNGMGITILSKGSTRLYGSVQPRAPEVCILADRDPQREINANIGEDSSFVLRE